VVDKAPNTCAGEEKDEDTSGEGPTPVDAIGEDCEGDSPIAGLMTVASDGGTPKPGSMKATRSEPTEQRSAEPHPRVTARSISLGVIWRSKSLIEDSGAA